MLICTCQVHVWIHISQKGKEMIHIFYTFVVFWGCHSLNNWRKATLPTQALVKIPCSWKRTLGEIYTRFDQKVSSHVLWKIKTFIQEDKRYKKHCTQKNDTSVSFKVGTFRPHTVSDLCWLQPVHVQHAQVLCSLQAFQNVDHFQQILDHLWSISATLLFVLHPLHCPWKSESSE